MHLNGQQIEFYRTKGYLLLPEVFSQSEIDLLKAELPFIVSEKSPRRILEKDGKTVRSVYGSHLTNMPYGHLTRHPRLLGPSQQIIGDNAYVYQFKINVKAAFGGDVWAWHQDFVFWQKEDGLPQPLLTNATVFLDGVDQNNGPILLVPGSHLRGVIDPISDESTSEPQAEPVANLASTPAWISHLTANLKYSIDPGQISDLIRSHGIVAATGAPGSVLFFHPNVVHGSTQNESGFDRTVIISTYNSVRNLPVAKKHPRPEFLASTDCRPLEMLSDDCLQSSRSEHVISPSHAT